MPSVVYRIPEDAGVGIDGVSIGSNDLTQLMLGVDRDSETCAELFDESDTAVLAAIRDIIVAAPDAGITSSLFAQAPSTKPVFGDPLARSGVPRVSVIPTASPSAGVGVAGATVRVVRQNLAWAFVYNLAAIPLAACGYVSPLLAGIGMAASSTLVVANALRLLRRAPPPAAPHIPLLASAS